MFGLLKMGLGYLFGGSSKESAGVSNAMEVAKGIGNFIDEQQFTPEERAAANAQALNATLEAVKATRDENSVRSVTRRVLAWSIMGSLLLAFWVAVLTKLLLNLDPSWIISIVDKFMLGELSLAVGSFYFVASLVRARK